MITFKLALADYLVCIIKKFYPSFGLEKCTRVGERRLLMF